MPDAAKPDLLPDGIVVSVNDMYGVRVKKNMNLKKNENAGTPC